MTSVLYKLKSIFSSYFFLQPYQNQPQLLMQPIFLQLWQNQSSLSYISANQEAVVYNKIYYYGCDRKESMILL